MDKVWQRFGCVGVELSDIKVINWWKTCFGNWFLKFWIGVINYTICLIDYTLCLFFQKNCFQLCSRIFHTQIFTIIMNNNKELWDLVKSIPDSELREKKSFMPHHIHGLLSKQAPHFYNQQKLKQIEDYHQFIKRQLNKKRVRSKLLSILASKSMKTSTSKKAPVSKRASAQPPPMVILALPKNDGV